MASYMMDFLWILDGFGEVSWKQEEFALIWSKLGRFKKNQGELLGLFFFCRKWLCFFGVFYGLFIWNASIECSLLAMCTLVHLSLYWYSVRSRTCRCGIHIWHCRILNSMFSQRSLIISPEIYTGRSRMTIFFKKKKSKYSTLALELDFDL